MRLEAEFPGHDAWLYGLNIGTTEFSAPSAHVSVSSTRTVHRVTVQGKFAYRKWDRKQLDGARDKIASDLAQILGVAVPASLLWKDSNDAGCVQREPPAFTTNLKSILEAAKVNPSGFEKVKHRLTSAYSPINLFFDLWLCNCDRAANLKNILVCETSTSSVIWLIDYDCALGHAIRPWTEKHFKNHGFDGNEPPIPAIFREDQNWVERLSNETDSLISRFANINPTAISQICMRACSFYGGKFSENGKQIADCLCERRKHLDIWVKGLLAQ